MVLAGIKGAITAAMRVHEGRFIQTLMMGYEALVHRALTSEQTASMVCGGPGCGCDAGS